MCALAESTQPLTEKLFPDYFVAATVSQVIGGEDHGVAE